MVTYRESINSGYNDGFSQSLKETFDYFKNKEHANILGEGFKDILTDERLFSEYVTRLTEGLDAVEESQMRTIMENARTEIFNESSVAGIPPIASLSMPAIRKMWAKISLKYALPTTPVKTPAFQVAFNIPFIIDEKNQKHYLPESLKDPYNTLAELPRLSDEYYEIDSLNEFDLVADSGAGKSAEAGDVIDRNFSVVGIKMDITDRDGSNKESVEVVVRNGKVSMDNRLYIEVEGVHSDGTKSTDVLFGVIYPEQGCVTCTCVNKKITHVKFLGFISSEAHNHATNVSFDVKRRDITIGNGEHIEASMPLEFLNDLKAMYSIDGTSELVDIMSNVVAQKVDLEAFKFIKGTWDEEPKYLAEFNVHPQGRFAGNPKDWLPEIRRVIDYVANNIKSDSYYYQGYFCIVGHTLDTMIIPDVSWTFNHVTDPQNGVEVDYNIGAMSSSNKYTIISSDLIPKGALYMFFVPTTDKFLTLKYYPYTFNVVSNYLNTRNAAIPSIMLTKRHTMERFLNLIGRINILNNDAKLVDSVTTGIDGVVQTQTV